MLSEGLVAYAYSEDDTSKTGETEHIRLRWNLFSYYDGIRMLDFQPEEVLQERTQTTATLLARMQRGVLSPAAFLKP